MKTCVQQSDHIFSYIHWLTVHWTLQNAIFPWNSLLQCVITVTTVLTHHIYRPYGNTVVTAVLPLSPLTCHLLTPTVYNSSLCTVQKEPATSGTGDWTGIITAWLGNTCARYASRYT